MKHSMFNFLINVIPSLIGVYSLINSCLVKRDVFQILLTNRDLNWWIYDKDCLYQRILYTEEIQSFDNLLVELYLYLCFIFFFIFKFLLNKMKGIMILLTISKSRANIIIRIQQDLLIHDTLITLQIRYHQYCNGYFISRFLFKYCISFLVVYL